MKFQFVLFLLLFGTPLMAQNKAVYVVEETQGNRMSFYAHNEDYKDYDVLVTITGSDFRQSKAKPRWIRLPSATRVHLKTIFLLKISLSCIRYLPTSILDKCSCDKTYLS